MTEQVQKRKRGGGRAGNALRRGSASIDQMPWHLPINTDKPTEPLFYKNKSSERKWSL